MRRILLLLLLAALINPAQVSAKRSKKKKGTDSTLVKKLMTDDWTKATKGAKRLTGIFPVYYNGAGGFFRGCPLHSPNQIS